MRRTEPRAARESAALPSQRQLKVGEQLRHLLAAAFLRGETHDPLLDGVSLTVSEVRMSRDLRHAVVYVSELGHEALRPEVGAALGRAAGRLGGRAAREMNLKYAPRLRFEPDDRFGEAERVERLLDEGLGPDRRGGPSSADEGEEG
ncbi:MAG: 30S ribosome-binding factor RbfA [Geminicoccaceae bacterium]|nr:30S ribosome-binding factor RbfA [Geminicoccaceae bacterium]